VTQKCVIKNTFIFQFSEWKQCRQMVLFQTKNPKSGLAMENVDIRILWMQSSLVPFDIFYGRLVYIFRGNLVSFLRFGKLCPAKSGNPAWKHVLLVSMIFWPSCRRLLF
jgi:hypothetical protein